jgi:hypothetical protein
VARRSYRCSDPQAKKQVIIMNLKRTEEKVSRAEKLLDSLSGERDRWTAQDAEFASSMKFIIGDSLLAAAFLAYGGYFDQSYRTAFMKVCFHRSIARAAAAAAHVHHSSIARPPLVRL